MQLTVFCKTVYGETKFYPLGRVATAYAKALGTKTLTRHALECAREMGFNIVLSSDATITEALRRVG